MVTNYNALQGFNPTQNFTLDFNTFTENPGATSAFEFVTIFSSDFSKVIASDLFLAPGTSSQLILANTPAANTSYVAEIDFSNRLGGADSLLGLPTSQLFDTRTEVAFTTGSASPTPEPGSLLLVALGAVSILGGRRFVRRKSSPAIER
jgi:hypothetical protein